MLSLLFEVGLDGTSLVWAETSEITFSRPNKEVKYEKPPIDQTLKMPSEKAKIATMILKLQIFIT